MIVVMPKDRSIGWVTYTAKGDKLPTVLRHVGSSRTDVWEKTLKGPSSWSSGRSPEVIGKNGWLVKSSDEYPYYFQFDSKGVCELVDIQLTSLHDFAEGKVADCHERLGGFVYKAAPQFSFPSPISSWYKKYNAYPLHQRRRDISSNDDAESYDKFVPWYDLYRFYVFIKTSETTTLCLEVMITGSKAFSGSTKFDPVTSKHVIEVKPKASFAEVLSRGHVTRVAHMQNRILLKKRGENSKTNSRSNWYTVSEWNTDTTGLLPEWLKRNKENASGW